MCLAGTGGWLFPSCWCGRGVYVTELSGTVNERGDDVVPGARGLRGRAQPASPVGRLVSSQLGQQWHLPQARQDAALFVPRSAAVLGEAARVSAQARLLGIRVGGADG
ncbi:hypothetical protein GCM10009609_66110 [Pseudonocardia aurantiaca]